MGLICFSPSFCSYLHVRTCVLCSTVCVETYFSETPAAFARLYKTHNLVGGHVIKLGNGNDEAAREALAAWPGQ
jgi:hypothetical protein